MLFKVRRAAEADLNKQLSSLVSPKKEECV